VRSDSLRSVELSTGGCCSRCVANLPVIVFLEEVAPDMASRKAKRFSERLGTPASDLDPSRLIKRQHEGSLQNGRQVSVGLNKDGRVELAIDRHRDDIECDRDVRLESSPPSTPLEGVNWRGLPHLGRNLVRGPRAAARARLHPPETRRRPGAGNRLGDYCREGRTHGRTPPGGAAAGLSPARRKSRPSPACLSSGLAHDFVIA
jgi:hypothetical protein